MGYEEISWTEASSEKSEVVGCVHEKSMILSGPSLEQAILANIWSNWIFLLWCLKRTPCS